MTHQFDELEKALSDVFPDLRSYMLPGLERGQIVELELELEPFHLPEECLALYQWHNGTEEPLSLVPGFDFLSLGSAIAEYEMLLSWSWHRGVEPGLVSHLVVSRRRVLHRALAQATSELSRISDL